MYTIIKFLGFNLLVSILLIGAATSETSDKCKGKKPDVTKTGVIASVGTYGMNASVDSQSASSTQGEEDSVISGSIKPAKPGKCMAVISNSSECSSYSVSFSVKKSKKSNGNIQHVTSSSASVPMKGSKEVMFSCDLDEYNYAIELTKVK
jgi:hypothetical protein